MIEDDYDDCENGEENQIQYIIDRISHIYPDSKYINSGADGCIFLNDGKIIKALMNPDEYDNQVHPEEMINIYHISLESGSTLIPDATFHEYDGVFYIIRDDISNLSISSFLDGFKYYVCSEWLSESLSNISHYVHEGMISVGTSNIEGIIEKLSQEINEYMKNIISPKEYEIFINENIYSPDNLIKFYAFSEYMEEKGIKLADLKPDNLGKNNNGDVVIRDTSRFFSDIPIQFKATINYINHNNSNTFHP